MLLDGAATARARFAAPESAEKAQRALHGVDMRTQKQRREEQRPPTEERLLNSGRGDGHKEESHKKKRVRCLLSYIIIMYESIKHML